jgi:hypothetical protein
MSGRQQKYDYTLNILNEVLRKEEKGLAIWKQIVDNPNSDHLSLRQAKGNIPSTENRIDELKKAIEVLNPPQQEPAKQ